MGPRALMLISTTLLVLPLSLVLIALVKDYRPDLSSEGWGLARPFLGRTLIFALASTVGQMIVGVAAALTVLWTTRSALKQTIVIAVFLLPYAIPASVVGLSFGFAAGPQSYWAEMMESVFSIPPGYWLYDHPLLSAVAASIWQYFPFAFLLTLLALRTIPADTLRAAQLDGATFSSITSKIVLRSIWPVLLAIFMLRFVFMLVKFDTPFVFLEKIATRDEVATLELWRSVRGSDSSHLGTIAWMLQLSAIAIALLYARIHRRGVA